MLPGSGAGVGNSKKSMKKVFTLALVAMAMMFAQTADAQVKFGLKGGVNVTNMSFSADVLDASNRAGFFVGPTVKFTLPVVGLGIDASALYDQRSAKVKYDQNNTEVEGDETLKQQQIAIPINVRYGFGLGSTASIFLFAGPQFGFNVGDKDVSVVDQVAKWRLKSSNISVNVGLGVMLLSHLQVSANYNIACGKTGEFEAVNQAGNLALETLGIKKGSRASAWQIALAYYF